MIVKKMGIPLRILILMALLRRLRPDHPKRKQIAEELDRRLAGLRGEESLDFYLSSLPIKSWMIFHDLNLSDGEYNCQIDTLLLSAKLSLIIDSKNYAGKILIDIETEQMIQTLDLKEKGYPYPIPQVERHQRCIRKFLLENNLPLVPVDYLVIFTNSHMILEFKGYNKNVKQRVCKSPSFSHKIELFEKMYIEKVLSAKDCNRLCKLLLKHNTPPTNFVLKCYGLEKSELLIGVQCPSCLRLSMARKNKQWYCPACRTFSNDAHVLLLQDYFLLGDSKITNKKFREIAHVSSPDASGRLLRMVNLKSSGKNKGRIYWTDTFPLELKS